MKRIFLLLILAIGYLKVHSQVLDTVFLENFNLANTNTSINNYPFTHQIPISGNASIRNTRSSNNYANASGGANVMFPNDSAIMSIKNIDVSNIINAQISFGLLKFGNELNGSDFTVTIIVHNAENDTIRFSPSLLTGLQTSNWRMINIPVFSLNNARNIDIIFNSANLINNSFEYRIDDIIVSGMSNIPLFNVFKSLNINTNNELVYALELRNNQYDFLTLEGSVDGKSFEAIETIYNPYNDGIFQINKDDASYYRLKVSIDNEVFTSQVRMKNSTNKNEYYLMEDKIIYTNTQNSIVIYNVSGNILKELKNTNIVDLDDFKNQMILIKSKNHVIKIWKQ